MHLGRGIAGLEDALVVAVVTRRRLPPLLRCVFCVAVSPGGNEPDQVHKQHPLPLLTGRDVVFPVYHYASVCLSCHATFLSE